MRRALILAFVVGFGALAPIAARAADPAWQQATMLLRDTTADMKSAGGVLGVASRADQLEHALSGGKDAMAAASDSGVLLTDGMGEMLIAIIMAKKQPNNGGRLTSIANPYPIMALYLGSYYNEVGRSEDALRVLDTGLALFYVTGPDLHLGDHWPALAYERGAALVALKRFSEALAGYDDVMKLTTIDNAMRARLHRSRGFALTELDRFEEAEAAYRESLKLEPDNARARAELDYIAKRRAGAPAAAGGLVPVQPQPPAKPQGI